MIERYIGEQFLGEIRCFSFHYAPYGWLKCDGQLLKINENQALYAILGTTYGGDGQTTFALPDLRGRVPVHIGNGITIGEKGGKEAHVLTVKEIPAHTHQITGSSKTATDKKASGKVWGIPSPSKNVFIEKPNSKMNPQALSPVGSSQAHQNMQPYIVANYCIAYLGYFPTQN